MPVMVLFDGSVVWWWCYLVMFGLFNSSVGGGVWWCLVVLV